MIADSESEANKKKEIFRLSRAISEDYQLSLSRIHIEKDDTAFLGYDGFML